jgi:DNA-binding PadR family transcriptional regulator
VRTSDDGALDLVSLFGPVYRPSPGGVYPAVKSLAAEGLIAEQPGGEPTRYRTTPEGIRAVEDRRDDLVWLEERTGVRLEGPEVLEEALERFGARVRRLAGRVDPARVAAMLEATATEIEDLDPRPLEGDHERPIRARC